MEYRITFFFLFVFCLTNAQDGNRDKYISKHKELAILEMEKFGIPASIKLAQGILESNNGTSKLAKEANNHFGIKCHNEWKGSKVFHNDDKKNECFRKYTDVANSYRDHSKFLKKNRYQNLFKLSTNDYKGWAKGLKKAGYATNPKYAQLLIKIIEDENLFELDSQGNNYASKKFFYGGVFGWPYIIGQKFLYKNIQKNFLLNSTIKASFDNISFLFGYNRLLIDEIGLGFEVGSKLIKNNSKQFDSSMLYALNISFLIPFNDKKIIIKPAYYFSKNEKIPSISFGILK